jgi:hypothetical protein
VLHGGRQGSLGRTNSINTEADVGQLGAQVRASIEFLKHLYRDLDGYPNHAFERVEICPWGQVGRNLQLTGSALRIGVPTGFNPLLGSIGLHSSRVLRDEWSKGEMLKGNPALATVGPVRWAIVDPAGTVRTGVRKGIRNASKQLLAKLATLDGQPDDVLRARLLPIVTDNVSPSAVDSSGTIIQNRVLTRLAGAKLQDFVSAWKRELSDGTLADKVEAASVAMRDVLQAKDVRVKVNQFGFVNVQNVHQIEVDFAVFLPNAKDFYRYVDVVKSRTDIEVNQWGFVNVQTNDLIKVNVEVLYERAAPTASAFRALSS